MRLYYLLLSGLLIACRMEPEPVRTISEGHVRSVTTTFTSHQNDTRQKHDQIVSVAEFNPDGSLIRMTNHMTYPYDYAQPIVADYWSEPNADELVHVMDGLDIGADRIFLYGNDWPQKYAEVIEGKGHPIYGAQWEKMFGGYKSTIPSKEGQFPLMIKTIANDQKSERIMHLVDGFEEYFEYEDGKVVDFRTEMTYNPEMMRRYREVSDGVKTSTSESKRNTPLYVYEGEKLKEYNNRNSQYKYFYAAGRLIRSEFHLKGKMRNHRLYIYNEQGLKEKTEIFNTYGEAEYTIEYHYDFYEES